jgi:hypothetical protein
VDAVPEARWLGEWLGDAVGPGEPGEVAGARQGPQTDR